MGPHAQALVTEKTMVKNLDSKILNLLLLTTCKYACFEVNHLTGPSLKIACL